MLELALDRPEAGNALTIPLARALLRAAIAADEDESVRCVVLTGRGRLFCAGGDVSGFVGGAVEAARHIKEITAYLHAAIARLMRVNKPLVTAINGPAAGAGLGLAIMGDVAIAARSAHFTVAYGAIGLTPDAGVSWLLPRLIGLRRAQEMALGNRRVGAEEAVAIGLVSRVVDDADLAGAVEATAAQLAASATEAIGRTRALLLGSYDTPLETHLDAETRSISASVRSPHGQEGVAAFLAKRAPDFQS
ncbi:MAG: enoyl-CoA hydratase-related protein [Rhizorhabdus sp.]